jgi:hypothetical protein
LAAERPRTGISPTVTISRQVPCSSTDISTRPEALKRNLDNLYQFQELKDCSTKSQRFLRPISSAFGFEVAKDLLQTMNGQDRPIEPDSHYLQENNTPGRSLDPVNP